MTNVGESREDLKAVEPGEHEIQHDQVKCRPFCPYERQRAFAAIRGDNAIAFLAEVVGNRGLKCGIIFYEQDRRFATAVSI